MGLEVGVPVVGEAVGKALGLGLGAGLSVGEAVGVPVGFAVTVGPPVGNADGEGEGAGDSVGDEVGAGPPTICNLRCDFLRSFGGSNFIVSRKMGGVQAQTWGMMSKAAKRFMLNEHGMWNAIMTPEM